MAVKSVQSSASKIEVLKKIDEYERQGLFSKDIFDDPPTIPLKPGQVDFLEKKFSTRFSMKLANFFARRYINKQIKLKTLIIKEVLGLQENFVPLENQGAIITCNHFSEFDNFAVYKALENHIHHNELYKVIREGNFTSMKGLYGYFFRHCNTLPLSSNFSVMKEFMNAVNELLQRGEKILVYAEQGMWWNYKKPRPVTSGAFKFASQNKVPVIPIFITMTDSDFTDKDGFPVQEYTVHILKAIFPDSSLSEKQNVKMMMEKNNLAWKNVYEEFYKKPLTYLH